MDWSNSKVLEFIELLQSEPTIWDPRRKLHINRLAVNDAWERIKSAFSVECSVEDLKKKRSSLMTCYREHLKKVKESCITGSGTDDLYQPIWFAFEAMHSFLSPVYEYQDTRNTEEQTTLNSERPLSRDSNLGSSGIDTSHYEHETPNKRKKTTKDLIQLKKQVDEAFSLVKDVRSVQKETDENDIFAQLLAKKLKKFNEEDRLMLTHDINNLVFKYEMKARSTSMIQSSPSQSSDKEMAGIYKPGPSSQSTVQTAQYESCSQPVLTSHTDVTNLNSKPGPSTNKKNIKIISQIIRRPCQIKKQKDIIKQAYSTDPNHDYYEDFEYLDSD